MGLTKGQLLTWLLIGFCICRLNAYQKYPAPATCETDRDCLRGKAKCIRRECHCTAANAFGDGKTKCDAWQKCEDLTFITKYLCLRTAGGENTQCLLPQKRGYGTCRCSVGYFGRPDFQGCMKGDPVEGSRPYPCLTNNNCPPSSHCYQNLCTCKHELRGDGETCTPPPPVKCKNDLDCKHKQGRCIDALCRCVGKYVGNGMYCRKAKSCPEDVKCVANSQCMIDPFFPTETSCECDPGFWKNVNGKCLDCIINYHCRQKYSICVHGNCGCRDGLVLTKKTCKFAAAKSCYNNAQCPHTKGRCIDGKCRCIDSHVGNGVYCKKAKRCSRNKCGNTGTCLIDPFISTINYCQCLPGFKYGKGGQCVECLSHADCNYEENSAECIKGKCKCKDELIREGKICKHAPIQVCRAQFDCHPKAKCRKGKCICEGWHIGNGRYCRASRPCGKVNPCGSNGQCLLDPLLLKSPYCRCKEGYEPHKETGKCVECSFNKDCNTDYSTCVDGECKCKDELIKKGKTCTHARLHVCESELNNDCHRNAKCIMKRCFCKRYTTGNGRFCRNSLLCPRGYRCVKHSTCVVDPLFPKTPVCKCDPGYQKSSKGLCVEMDDCQKQGLDCLVGSKCGVTPSGTMGCICVTGYKTTPHNNKTTCEDIDECATGQARCSGDRCTNTVGSYTCIPCPPGFTDGADGLCVGTVQGACNCKKNEECRRGKCRCKTGYIRSSQGLCVGGISGEPEDETNSGNSHFAYYPSFLAALGMLGCLAFST